MGQSGQTWVKFGPNICLMPPNTRESEVSEIVKDPQHKVVQLSLAPSKLRTL